MAAARKEPRTTMGKLWHFLWHDNSVWSWIVNIVLAYVLIKFLVYPGLGLLMGTTHPIVAVVSSSMEHPGGFDAWWESAALCETPCTQAGWYAAAGIGREQFREFPFRHGFNKGDIIILVGSSPERIAIGNVIVFKSSRPDPIIHRVVKKSFINGHYFFQTKGDHNMASISSVPLNELAINDEQVIGKAVFRLPFLGWIKIGFVELLAGVR
jgi:signal peptidase I